MEIGSGSTSRETPKSHTKEDSVPSNFIDQVHEEANGTMSEAFQQLPVQPRTPTRPQHDVTYGYQPLQNEHIRIMELIPGTPDEVIRVSLHHRKVSESPSYEAISYAWGKPVRERPIICEGGVLKITTNMLILLKRLRSLSDPLILWIDAICINQDDLLERSRQVPRMSEIFRTANTVLVWLGEEGPCTGEAFEIIPILVDVLNSITPRPKFDGHIGNIKDPSGILPKDWIEDLIKKPA
jgi:Heterokaryon incompatibility protein (HET)